MNKSNVMSKFEFLEPDCVCWAIRKIIFYYGSKSMLIGNVIQNSLTYIKVRGIDINLKSSQSRVQLWNDWHVAACFTCLKIAKPRSEISFYDLTQFEVGEKHHRVLQRCIWRLHNILQEQVLHISQWYKLIATTSLLIEPANMATFSLSDAVPTDKSLLHVDTCICANIRPLVFRCYTKCWGDELRTLAIVIINYATGNN